MNDGGDAILLDRPGDQFAVAGRTIDERHRGREQIAESGRQIVEHDDGIAGVDQLMYHVAADVTGAARDQNRHYCPRLGLGHLAARRQKKSL